MFRNGQEKTSNGLEAEVRELQIEEDEDEFKPTDLVDLANGVEDVKPKIESLGTSSDSPRPASPIMSRHNDNAETAGRHAQDAIVNQNVLVKPEPGEPPKLSRGSSSKKQSMNSPQLFPDLPDRTAEATSTFQVIKDCTYAAKYLGYTEHALECDCAEEWGKISFLLSFIV